MTVTAMYFIRCIPLIAIFQTIYVKSESNKIPHLLGGEYTIIKEFPFAAAILYKSGNAFVCGGTVVRSDVIITAGHCCFKRIESNGKELYRKEPPGKFIVAAGHDNYRSKAIQKAAVRKFEVHPKHKHNDGTINDIALAFLTKHFRLGTIQPVKLNKKWPSYIKTVYLFGWGGTVPLKEVVVISTHLKFKSIQIIPKGLCQKLLTNNRHYYNPGHMCAGDNQIKIENNMFLPGESGSGVVLNGGILVGLKSIDDLEDVPGVELLTNVTYFYDWIQKTLVENGG